MGYEPRAAAQDVDAIIGADKDIGDRMDRLLEAFDDYLASDEPLACTCEQVFQGPIADAFTHVGQIAMLRRMAGCPMKGENYFVADITAGRVGRDQAQPRREFD